jgi:rare lipoprotein A (peptidoglycan hydrolase)
MRIDSKQTATLLASIGLAWTVAPGVSALATAGGSTGGARAPASASASRRAPKQIRSSEIATWFGPGFYGQKTACGQTLTPGVVGVAHRTLPCGTLVAVTYRGHTVVVPVLDRGPYSRIGANWDLTAGAAQALEITGTVRILTRVLGRTANTPALGAPAAPSEAPGAARAGGAIAG